ncbi:MAG: ATP-dependent Clp protease ATP-binding subunit [Candidatus Moranbacteria bacterium]|nr:ATP-dependent Clp protease ATP-binding subunit [Candidatus Moranbacteria bacterium]
MIPERLSEKLSLHARKTLEEAGVIARAAGSDTVLPKHLLLSILLEQGSFGSLFLGNTGLKKEFLGQFCLSDTAATNGIPQKKGRGQNKTRRDIPFSSATKTVLAQAYFIASDFRSPYVGTEHLVYSLIENPDPELADILSIGGIEPDPVLETLESHLEPDHFPSFGKLLDLPDLSLARPDESQKDDTPSLSQFTVDLGRDSRERGEEFFGRDTEIDRVIRILGRKEKNNPLLLGEPGVGKTAIVSALARRLGEGTAPGTLTGKRILALDLALVVAGTSFRGEFEARLKDIVREAKGHPEVILFIDELHTIVGAGNTSGGLDAANILKPALARGEIRVIGATTITEYKKHIEKDPALSRRFQTVSVDEPSPEESRRLLRHIRGSYERFHGVAIGTDLLDLAVSLSVRHLHGRFLPDKAIDILDEASSLAKNRRGTDHAGRAAAAIESALRNLAMEKESLISEGKYDEAAKLLDDETRLRTEKEGLERRSKAGKPKSPAVKVVRRDLLETVSAMTGIPFSSLENETPADRLSCLGTGLRSAVTHQEEAISVIESSLARALGGVRDPDRPLGSFLFLGPTGVGKTLLAKTIAEKFFGDGNRLIRFDMSEFMERHSVAQMLGAPAGYIGYGEGGRLTERIRRTPHAVVLFDEIEKAHPDVSNILLQILDEGTITDAEGMKVNFRDALVILTSNVGTESFIGKGRIGFSEQDLTGLALESVKRTVLEEAKKSLRPELIARLGNTVIFNPLGTDAMERVARIEFDTLRARLRGQGVTLSASAPVIRFLAERSFAPEHGARLVRRNIEELVSLPLARKLIATGFDPETPGRRIRIILSVRNGSIECAIS